MSLYRIYGDDAHYLNFVVDGVDVIKKLGGRDYPFHIDRTPKPYAAVWKAPVIVDFHYGKAVKSKVLPDVAEKVLPDIAENGGRLYFNEHAYQLLHSLIDECGEFLPVYHDDGSGYVFNPLKSAEDVSGIDSERTLFDTHGNLAHFSFHDDKVKPFPIFRTALDTYLGIFCQEEFKSAVERNDLKGISFGSDLSNPIGVSYGGRH